MQEGDGVQSEPEVGTQKVAQEEGNYCQPCSSRSRWLLARLPIQLARAKVSGVGYLSADRFACHPVYGICC